MSALVIDDDAVFAGEILDLIRPGQLLLAEPVHEHERRRIV